MSDDFTYRPVRAGEPLDELVLALRLAFGVEHAVAERWLETAGRGVLRRLDGGAGKLAASLYDIPMGLFLGGASVPIQAIAAVAVMPEQRRAGVGKRIMEAALREAHGRGAALSVLYSARQPFYRRFGYELAGIHMEHKIDLARAEPATRPDGSLRVRPFVEADFPAVARCFAAYARGRGGHLDRGEDRKGYIWTRVIDGRVVGNVLGFVVEDGRGEVRGHTFYQHAGDPRESRLHLTDLVALDGEAARTLIAFLAGHSSIQKGASFTGGPTHPVLHELSEQVWSSRVVYPWMVRVVDVAGALSGRGYTRHMSAEVTLDVRDDLLPANAGAWRVAVRDGAAQVERVGGAGGPGLRLDIRALASLLTGYASAGELASLGVVEGPREAVEAAESVFAGPVPSMPDPF